MLVCGMSVWMLRSKAAPETSSQLNPLDPTARCCPPTAVTPAVDFVEDVLSRTEPWAKFSRPAEAHRVGWGLWIMMSSRRMVLRLHEAKCLINVILPVSSSMSAAWTPSPELEPEPPDFAAKVFWPLLCPVRGQEHQSRRDEQYFTMLCTHAPQIWSKGFHIQEASVQEGKREVQTHF